MLSHFFSASVTLLHLREVMVCQGSAALAQIWAAAAVATVRNDADCEVRIVASKVLLRETCNLHQVS